MKHIKKVLSGIIAVSMCMSSVVMNVSATSTTYIMGDVNGNGIVDVNDYTSIIQFLSGRRYANGRVAERLDYNQDGVISQYDVKKISDILLENQSTSTTNSTNTDNLPAQARRLYYKFDLTTNSHTMSSYALDTLSSLDDLSTYSIIDSDDRYIENGLHGVVRATTSTSTGTAFVIGEHTILTAAHVLAESSGQHINYDINFKFYNDYNQITNFSVTPTAFHIPMLYFGNNSWVFDYALVTVEEDLSSYVNFDLGVMRDCMSRNKTLYVTGFGGDNGNIEPELVLNRSTGAGCLSPVGITSASNWNRAIYFNADTVAGDSGAPVYIKNPDGTNTVIGICNYESTHFNQATRITPDILHFVYNNPNL